MTQLKRDCNPTLNSACVYLFLTKPLLFFAFYFLLSEIFDTATVCKYFYASLSLHRQLSYNCCPFMMVNGIKQMVIMH